MANPIGMSCDGEAEAEYFSKDFDWEELRAEVEANPSFRYHFESTSSSLQLPSPESDVKAWKQFHVRHASGKFFKERCYLLKEFPEILSSSPNSKLLEVGCGNGSTVLPILRHKGFLSKFVKHLQDMSFLREDLIFSTHSEEGTDSGVDTSVFAPILDLKVYPRDIYAFGLVAWIGNDVLNRRANKDVIVYACDCSNERGLKRS